VGYPSGGTSGSGVDEVVTADFNGDGRVDVAGLMWGSYWPIGINVHLNQALSGCY
jgi:hypothetical protein